MVDSVVDAKDEVGDGEEVNEFTTNEGEECPFVKGSSESNK